MKATVIYDSLYGNTQKIAEALRLALGPQAEVNVLRITEARPEQLSGLDLLVAGSPTQRFRPTLPVMDFLKSLPPNSLKGVKAAAFDTRLTQQEIKKTSVLAFFVRLAGSGAWAAPYIAKGLKKGGASLLLPPEGFTVEGMEGPLSEGELERAVRWAGQVAAGLVG